MILVYLKHLDLDTIIHIKLIHSSTTPLGSKIFNNIITNRIGKTERKEYYSNSLNMAKTNPGPGNYNLPTEFNKKKGFKLQNEKRFKDTKPSPGPGDYKLPCSFSNVPLYSNGKFDKTMRYI